MANKMTKRDYFTILREMATAENRADLVEFIDHELELLARKSENRVTKPTESQILNAAIGERIPSLLNPNQYYRLSEIKEKIPELAEVSGTQRIATICNKLVADGKLTKEIVKRVVYYKLAE